MAMTMSSRHLMSRFLMYAALLLLFLSSCGGGGSGTPPLLVGSPDSRIPDELLAYVPMLTPVINEDLLQTESPNDDDLATVEFIPPPSDASESGKGAGLPSNPVGNNRVPPLKAAHLQPQEPSRSLSGPTTESRSPILKCLSSFPHKVFVQQRKERNI